MPKDKLMDKDALLKIFDYLNKQLKENQLVLELTIYGGAIMTLVYDNRPATKDIDCIFSPANEAILGNILELTKFTFNLPDKWINEDVKEALLNICAQYISLNLIGERQMRFIQYLGKDLGYDWK